MLNKKEIGERLSEAMFDKDNMTVEQLAKVTNVSVQTVYRWLRGENLFSLSNLLIIADALSCTIDFLVGRNESFLDFIPKKSSTFYERLCEILKSKNITWYKLMKDTTIKSGHKHKWKNGVEEIKISSLITLANYLDCSIDFILGRDR